MLGNQSKFRVVDKLLKINSVEIDGIGGIQKLKLEFKPGLNLLCGPNGIGKTTILDCISHSFSSLPTSFVRRNVNSEEGKWAVNVDTDTQNATITSRRRTFHPFDDQRQRVESYNHFPHHAKETIVFKTYRTIAYNRLANVAADPVKTDNVYLHEVVNGVSAQDVKQWFISRFMFLPHGNVLSSTQIENYNLAKECFGMLDDKISFANVQADKFEILVNSPDGAIYYEYLSSGYMSCLYLLLGLIKEIEFRFKDPGINVREFDGLILIDELDLHLHPQWQGKLIQVLKKMIPKAQIIATTHSPHMIQAADPNEIIALEFDSQNKVCVRELPASEFGFQGWSIEEILTDVMGLEETQSPQYNDAMSKFDKALDEENIDEALDAFKDLDKMLHPKSHIRKLLRLQMAGIGGELD